MKSIYAALFILMCGIGGNAHSLAHQDAKALFDAVNTTCDQSVRIWKHSLCGPVALVNPEVNQIITNEPVAGFSPLNDTGIYLGPYDKGAPHANTSGLWKGRQWSFVKWPAFGNLEQQVDLVLHESFHRDSPQFLPVESSGVNAHLDQEKARVLLRLEWRALNQFLTSSELGHLKSALKFAQQRHSDHVGAREAENGLMLNEGMAQYTGLVLAASEPKKQLMNELNSQESNSSFSRSFAYYSGPLWGLAMDNVSQQWRDVLMEKRDFWRVVADIVDGMDGVAFDGGHYQLGLIASQEQKIAQQQAQLLSGLNKQFSSDQSLRIPMQSLNYQFNPSLVTPLPNVGNAYKGMTVFAEWGELKCEDYCVLSSDFKSVLVPKPVHVTSKGLVGDSWSLTLENGWEIDTKEHLPMLTAPN